MTVQELIDELNKVEDKSKSVYTDDTGGIYTVIIDSDGDVILT